MENKFLEEKNGKMKKSISEYCWPEEILNLGI